MVDNLLLVEPAWLFALPVHPVALSMDIAVRMLYGHLFFVKYIVLTSVSNFVWEDVTRYGPIHRILA